MAGAINIVAALDFERMTAEYLALQHQEEMAREECLVPKDQEEAVVRVTSYLRHDLPLRLIHFPPSVHKGVKSSLSSSRVPEPEANMGQLSLPMDILTQIVLSLDIRTVFQLRQVNSVARAAVDSFLEYKLLSKHALKVYCALMRTNLAGRVTLNDFFDLMCTKECVLCGAEFGGFVFLPTWLRCCYSCIQTAPQTKICEAKGLENALLWMDVADTDFFDFTCLRGRYTASAALLKEPTQLVPLVQDGVPEIPFRFLPSTIEIFRYVGSCSLPYYNKHVGTVEHGISCSGCQLEFERRVFKDFDFDSIARSSQTYSDAGFLEHFKKCLPAQALWEASEGGLCEPNDLPRSTKKGGFMDLRP